MTEEVKSVEETAVVEPEQSAEVEQPPEVETKEPEQTDEFQLPPPTKKKQTAQERIDEITRARREAEREAEYWRSKALGEAKEDRVEPPPQVGVRPRLEQFKTTEEYEDALLEWHTAQREVRARAERRKTEEETALERFKERAEKVREVYEDFDEVVDRPVFSSTMRSVLLRSDNGPEVAYFLGRTENQSIAARIKKLSAEDQIYELGKLESKLLLAKTTKKSTGAPPPITPVGGTTGGGEVDWSKLSDDEWFARRKAEKIKKLQSRG